MAEDSGGYVGPPDVTSTLYLQETHENADCWRLDDYVTRGVTLGGNSSAIATALLLNSDPRAAALSSLSMSLFGTVLVALTSIPPVVRAVLALVGSEGQ